MKVLFYTARHDESAERLKQSIQALGSLECLTDCWNLTELAQHFQTPAPLPETVVLQAASTHDLRIFENFRSRLEQVFFILVLPDAEAETIAWGHQLRPRFIVYQDSDFTEIEAVLGWLESRQGRAAGLLSPPPLSTIPTCL